MAYLALFVALGGTSAFAANTVFSSDIVDGEGKTDDIGSGEVENSDLALDSVGSGKIVDGQVKNADLGPGASSSNTIANGGVRSVDVADDSTAFALTGTDIALDSLTGSDIAADSLTGEDIDESTLSDRFDTSIRLCRTDGPLHLATSTVRPVCTFGAFSIFAQCVEDLSDPIAMLSWIPQSITRSSWLARIPTICRTSTATIPWLGYSALAARTDQ